MPIFFEYITKLTTHIYPTYDTPYTAFNLVFRPPIAAVWRWAQHRWRRWPSKKTLVASPNPKKGRSSTVRYETNYLPHGTYCIMFTHCTAVSRFENFPPVAAICRRAPHRCRRCSKKSWTIIRKGQLFTLRRRTL